jgi:hypothetical protein
MVTSAVFRPLVAVGTLAASCAHWAEAQNIRPRDVTTVVGRSPASLIGPTQALETPSGVLVNDGRGRRLFLFGNDLASARVLLDSVGGRDSQYGWTERGRLSLFRGDSLLFLNRDRAMILAPDGSPSRTSPPDVRVSAGSLADPHAWSRTGVLFVFRLGSFPPAAAPTPAMPRTRTRQDDSVVIGRVDAATSRVDTLVRYRRSTVTHWRAGGSASNRQDAYPTADHWSTTRDGGLVVVRARDNRVEWRGPDGSLRASVPLPYSRTTMSAGERARIVDSLNAVRRRAYDSARVDWVRDSTDAMQGRPWIGNGYWGTGGMAPIPTRGGPGPTPQAIAARGRLTTAPPTSARGGGAGASAMGARPPTTASDTVQGRGARGGGMGAAAVGASPPAAQGSDARGGGSGAIGAGAQVPSGTFRPPTISTSNYADGTSAQQFSDGARIATSPVLRLVTAADIPDHLPAISDAAGTLIVDPEDRAWIRPANQPPESNGGVIYDVFSARGGHVERVRLASGRTLIGFGRDGVLYLAVQDGSAMAIERVR